MNGKHVLGSAVLFAAGTLLSAGNALAQFGAPVKVSDVIEGGSAGVSSARCGSGVVAGFGDVESGKPNSFDGFSYSKDGGHTFTDGGTLPVASSNDVLGLEGIPLINPSVACSSASRFYYASVGSTGNPPPPASGFTASTTISVSTSVDGGVHWSLPTVVTSHLSDTEELLAPSIAVDPTNPSRVYLAYLHEFTGSPVILPDNNCLPPAFGLEFAKSLDAGKTWQVASSPVDYACFPDTTAEHTGTLGAPTLTISPGGKVYIAYEFMGQDQSGQPTHNEIRFTRSWTQGASFTAPIVVSTDAINNAPLQLAVDRTFLRSRGTIYLSWPGAPTGTYTDVLMSDSVSFGVSFSFPRPISPAPAAGSGRFQTDPVVAVDNDGQVVDCFYSTPTNTPSSSSVYSYNCATSFNKAASWTAQRLASLVPQGFDALTSDFLLHNDGFFTAYEVKNSTGQRHVVGQTSDNP